MESLKNLIAIAVVLSGGVVAEARPRLSLLSGITIPAQAQAFYARLSKQPSAAKKSQYNALFTCAAAQIAKLDALYIFSTNAASGVQADSQSIAFTNLISSSFGITKNGNGSFAQGVGYQGNGSAGDFLDTGFVPSSAAGKYANSSAHLGVVINNNRTVNQTWKEIGTSSGTTIFDYIINLWSDGNSYLSIEGTNSTSVANAAGTQGVWISTRTASNLSTMYLNGTSIVTNADPFIGLANNSIVIGAGRGTTGVIQNNSNDIFSAAFFGGGLSAADAATISTCLGPITTQSMPFQASLSGFKNNVISETFSDGLAGIDINNTKAAGYRWYVAPYFNSNAAAAVPASGDFTYSGGVLNIKASTNATTYRARLHRRGNTSSYFQGTISGTTLTITSMATGSNVVAAGQVLAGVNVTANSIIQPFGTSGTTGVGGAGTYALSQSSSIGAAQSIVGQSSVGNATLPPGGYFECKMAFDQTLTTGSQTGGWPACWMQDQAGLYSQNLTASYGTGLEFFEVDFLEGKPTGAGAAAQLRNTFDWSNTFGGGFGSTNGITTSVGTGAGANVIHTYGTLWLTTAKNAGVGALSFYVDGIHVSGADMTYTTTTGSTPASSPSNPNGVLSVSENDNFVFMIEGGFEIPGKYTGVSAWQ